jgi:hypothetical protein
MFVLSVRLKFNLLLNRHRSSSIAYEDVNHAKRAMLISDAEFMLKEIEGCSQSMEHREVALRIRVQRRVSDFGM